MGCVYLITSPSGKQYVGITTVGLNARWKDHQKDARLGSQAALHRAIRKYGSPSFKIEVLEEQLDWATLCLREVELIAEMGTLSPLGYNCTTGGDGTVQFAQEVVDRIASKQKARWARDGEREAQSRRASSQWGDPTFYDAVRSSNRLAWSDPERRAAASSHQKTRLSKPEAAAELERRAARLRALWSDPEYRARMSKPRSHSVVA